MPLPLPGQFSTERGSGDSSDSHGSSFPVGAAVAASFLERFKLKATFSISGNPTVVTDRERQLNQDFWARRGQAPPSRGRIRLQPRERIFVALGIATAVMVVVMGILR